MNLNSYIPCQLAVHHLHDLLEDAERRQLAAQVRPCRSAPSFRFALHPRALGRRAARGPCFSTSSPCAAKR